MKLNISLIVRMLGEMRVALKINFSRDVMKMRRRAAAKILDSFRKNNDLLFLPFYKLSAPGQIANVFNVFLPKTAMLGSSGYSLQSNTYDKFYRVYFGCQNVLAHSLIDNRH